MKGTVAVAPETVSPRTTTETEISPRGMSDSNFVQPSLMKADDAAAEALLDISSLTTVIAMLEVIDSVEELALLETLTPTQKRQVWEVTPEVTRTRLIQLRMAQTQPAEPEFDRDQASSLETEATTTDWLLSADDTSAIDLEVLEQIDLSLQVSLHLPHAPSIHSGDWIVLQARPNLSSAELMAIWKVTSVGDNQAQISAEQLGSRTYPIAWMKVYPKPIELEPEF